MAGRLLCRNFKFLNCYTKQMKKDQNIVIFGAGGKVGSLLVEYALADGYRVTAFVHRHHNLPNDPHLTIVKGDVSNAADVEKAVSGADAVLSALSSWGTPKKDVLSVGMKSIIPAMQKHKLKRIVSLTGADARAPGDHLGIIHRLSYPILGIMAGKVLHDGENHIALLATSNLDWTVLRSPVMLSGQKMTYNLSDKRPLPTAVVNRRAVARAMIDQIEDNRFLRQAVFIR